MRNAGKNVRYAPLQHGMNREAQGTEWFNYATAINDKQVNADESARIARRYADYKLPPCLQPLPHLLLHQQET
jgi:hypothetical protein